MSEKKKHRVIIGIELFLLCMIIATLSINATSMSPPSNGVSYNKNNQVTVQNALDDLYNKANYGNATASQILKGRTALVGGKQITGTYVAPTLASQTPGDAKPENLDEGKIAWVNGEKIVGTKMTPLAQMLKLGDYVKYIPRTGRELTLWRVLQKNGDGTVDIVSEYVSSSSRNFNTTNGGFEKYVETLNEIVALYETEGYTVGSRNIGYDSYQTEEVADLNSGNDDGYKRDVSLLQTVLGTAQAWKVGDNNERWNHSGYFLASRYKAGAIKGVYVIDYDGLVKVEKFQGLNGNQSLGSSDSPVFYSVRPVVVLKSTLKITGGDGTKESPYTLGV